MSGTRRKMTAILTSFLFFAVVLCGCAQPAKQSGFETEQLKVTEVPATEVQTTNASNSQYAFWEKENQLRFFLPLVETRIVAAEEETELGNLELPEKYKKRTEVLKKAMISYFKDNYNIDISSELENQKLKAFSSEGIRDNEMMGYVDMNNPEYLNLNESLFKENAILFDNTYVHETLHYLGFRSENPNLIDEGITDALADLILQSANINSYATPFYFEARELAYQILEVDKDIANFYLEDGEPQIEERIDKRLKGVKRPFKDQDPGEALAMVLEGLTNGMSGTIDSYYVAFQAQEVVRAYCQTFNPSHKSINRIRSHYFVEGYEETEIRKEGDNYIFE